MSANIPQRWCEPRVLLAATNLRDQPALLRHAVGDARRSGARLLLVHVISSAAQSEDASAMPSRVLLLPSMESAASALDHVALQLQWQGILCEPVVLKGRPDEQIQTLVQTRGVDRVYVSARSHPDAIAPHAVSLAEKLIASLAAPVCVVGNHVHANAGSDLIPGRVLLALSLRSFQSEYVNFACGVARARRARLTLLHVLDRSCASDRQRARDAARLRLAALVASHGDLPWPADIDVREGDPSALIVEEAICPFRDLIILGSSSLQPSGAGQKSSVIHRVIVEARCPVITLKRPATESLEKTGSQD